MSKAPTPKLDRLREMREARYASTRPPQKKPREKPEAKSKPEEKKL